MAWRFAKQKKIAPGVTLRVGKSLVPSVRLGGKNVGVNVGKRGVSASASVPGTGVSVQQKLVGGTKKKPAKQETQVVESTVKRSMIVVLCGLLGALMFGAFAVVSGMQKQWVPAIVTGGISVCLYLFARSKRPQ